MSNKVWNCIRYCALFVAIVLFAAYWVTVANAEDGYVSIQDEYLNVRDLPSKDGKRIGKLYQNDQVTIIEKNGDWYKIEYSDSIGYVSSEYVSDKPVTISELPATSLPLKSENIPAMQPKYVALLAKKTSAYPMKSKKRNCYVHPGYVAVMDVDDNYAIIAKDRQLLRIAKENFDFFLEVNPEGKLSQEAIVACYSTFFSTSNKNRTNNIKVGAVAMQKVLKPDETYSFNGIVGKRTQEKGYMEAGAYNHGKKVTAYGGGVCQLSSTLYAAIRLNKHFSVIERYEHSPEVTYLPLGMDATVNWNNRDLKFVNNYDCDIEIQVFVDTGRVTVIVRKSV